MSWLAGLLKRAPSLDEARNDGLALAMDWGEQWLSPIQDRLGRRHRSLDRSALDRINDECQGAMRLGHETVHAFVRDGTPPLVAESLTPVLRASFPWISDANVQRLFRQGLYYAAKAGGPARDKV
jgi:hypothetical protein